MGKAGPFKYYRKKAVRALRAMLIHSPWRKKAFYLTDDFPEEVKPIKSGLYFSLLDLEIACDELVFVLDAYPILRLFPNNGKFQFEIAGNSLCVGIDGLRLLTTTEEEIFIINEIFVNGTYNFVNATNLIAVDIGMNVGFASLFLANRKDISKVYSFEPLKPTYAQAIKNIELNPSQGAKITHFPYGLGHKMENLEVSYSYEHKGQVGIYGTDLVVAAVQHSVRESILIKPASEELRRIMQLHPESKFLLKIDCEGAEYDILRSLAEDGLLRQVAIVFIEWHVKGPEELLGALSNNGFTCFYQNVAHKNIGLIYASARQA